jgi:hypothetical protein
MADLLESVPPETPVTPSDGAQPPVTPGDGAAPPGDQADLEAEPAKPARRPVDIDATIEEALAATRKAADDRKAADAAMKAAKELEAKYAPFAKLPPEQIEAYSKLSPEGLQRYLAATEHLGKKERAAAVEKLLGTIDEDLLFDLAQKVGVVAEQGEKPPEPAAPAAQTVKDLVAAELASRDRVAADKKAEDDKKAAETQAAADQAEVDTWMKRSATALRTEIDNYPWIKAWGCDAAQYQKLTVDWIEKNKALPEPAQILQLIEDEHIARHRKSPGAPKEPPPLDELEDPAGQAAATYERHRPPGPRVTQDDKIIDPVDQARAELDAYDRQQQQRLRWGR